MGKFKQYLTNYSHIAVSKFKEYLPKGMHAAGSLVCVGSGIPSLPYNPGYAFNVAVGILLGYEILPKEPKDYLPSSKYDALVAAYHGINYSRDVKILFGVASGVMSIWFAAQGNKEAAIQSLVFVSGLGLSAGGSQIEANRVKNTLDKIKPIKSLDEIKKE